MSWRPVGGPGAGRTASRIGLKFRAPRADDRVGIVWDHWEADMRCPACANTALIEIRMEVGGSPLTFRRCARCEHQGWETLDAPLTLDHVLDLARR